MLLARVIFLALPTLGSGFAATALGVGFSAEEAEALSRIKSGVFPYRLANPNLPTLVGGFRAFTNGDTDGEFIRQPLESSTGRTASVWFWAWVFPSTTLPPAESSRTWRSADGVGGSCLARCIWSAAPRRCVPPVRRYPLSRRAWRTRP